MILGARFIAFIFLSVILVSQYQNCSNYSENTMFENSLQSSTVDTATAGATNTNFSIKNFQSDLYVPGLDDHIQLGGTCNPGGHLQNYFEIQLIPQNSGAVVVNPLGATDAQKRILGDAKVKCENGKFYLIVPVLCPVEGGPSIATTTPAQVKVYFHAYDGYDASNQMKNHKQIDQSIFIDLYPQQGCVAL